MQDTYYRDMDNEERTIHWLETIVGRLDIMNNNIVSLISLQQHIISNTKGTTTIHCDGGHSFEISECMNNNEGGVYHVHWCKGECNL